jgi:uncharacterized protein YndB with AHSA1/START domain
MLWLWIALGIVAALVLVLFVGGALLPRAHVATSSITLEAKPADVWAAIADWRTLQSWRKDVTAVEELPTRDGWVETSKFGRLPLRVEKSERERLLVTRIADDKLPFGGTWTWRLEPTPDGGTRVSTTEDGFVGPPPFRLLSRFVFGHHATLNAVHRALAAKFGETVTPVNS